jgi:alkylated DNA repair dioxygenase AlkB
MSQEQLSWLPEPVPEGFVYIPDFVTRLQEQDLVEQFRQLPFKEFEFHGYQGKRRVVYFGYRYDFNASTLRPVEEIPEFLLPLRDRAAWFAGLAPGNLRQALIAEYAPGAGIGWHKDRAAFDDVIGISFESQCRFRFQQKRGGGWDRLSVMLEPRSAYLLRGAARTAWEHSIPPGEMLRYSVTFRSMVMQQS